tara:strand:- start:116 stop:343 length:228 start_codon:yes stop_codon:yes gene_type:complete
MRLQEQFLNAHSISGGIGMNEKQANHCEKLADEFAMDFANWLNNHVLDEFGKHHRLNGNLMVSDLLLFYKNEKKL